MSENGIKGDKQYTEEDLKNEQIRHAKSVLENNKSNQPTPANIAKAIKDTRSKSALMRNVGNLRHSTE